MDSYKRSVIKRQLVTSSQLTAKKASNGRNDKVITFNSPSSAYQSPESNHIAVVSLSCDGNDKNTPHKERESPHTPPINELWSSNSTRPSPLDGKDKIFEDIISSKRLTDARNKQSDSSEPTCSITTATSEQMSVTSYSSSLDTYMTEDYFAFPELGPLGFTSTEDYNVAIEQCKDMIQDLPENSPQRKVLVKNLVDLRMKLQEAKDLPKENDSKAKNVLGHKFCKASNRTMKHYCDCCSTMIWGMLQVRYKCKECSFNVHAKCIGVVRRSCVAVVSKSLTAFQLNICPEVGLSEQQYCCAECKNKISIVSGESEAEEARLCDYTGLYYCANCHWNDALVLPARVMHNWDYGPYRVCRQSFQLLKAMHERPILNIQEINPMLFNFVEELSEIRKMREDILKMKVYLMTCQAACDAKLLCKLEKRQHFVDNSDMYTMKDLTDMFNNILLLELQRIHAEFSKHIKFDCSTCPAKGFVCEICNSGNTLFPFDSLVSTCPNCFAVFHGDCFSCIDTMCPRCKRKQQRKSVAASTASLSQFTDDDDWESGNDSSNEDDSIYLSRAYTRRKRSGGDGTPPAQRERSGAFSIVVAPRSYPDVSPMTQSAVSVQPLRPQTLNLNKNNSYRDSPGQISAPDEFYYKMLGATHQFDTDDSLGLNTHMDSTNSPSIVEPRISSKIVGVDSVVQRNLNNEFIQSALSRGGANSFVAHDSASSSSRNLNPFFFNNDSGEGADSKDADATRSRRSDNPFESDVVDSDVVYDDAMNPFVSDLNGNKTLNQNPFQMT